MTRKYHYVFFDFDGTVADTKQGIIKAASYSLDSFNVPHTQEELMRFVGPTLWYSFGNYYGFDEEKQFEAVKKYREYYSEKGIFEACLYDGIKELLRDLRNAGIKTAIASAKETKSVMRALEHFGVLNDFDEIACSFEDGTRSDKYELINYLKERFSLTSCEDVLFVGDSRTDCTGAKKHNMDFAAALYDRDIKEFDSLPVDYLIHSVDDLRGILI